MALSWGQGISLVGPQGQAGSMIYFGTGEPSASLGITNDCYFATDTNKFYNKGASGWNNGNLLQGATGLTGVSGASFYAGSGTPTMSANDGDLYLNLSGGEIYKHVSGAWSDAGYSIMGPQGKRGTITTSGSSAPTTSSPANSQAGDRYVLQTTGEVYSFDGTQWNDLGYSTVGPQGPAGATGQAGQVGATGQRGSITTSGSAVPTTSSPANNLAGDRYVVQSTGEVYSFDGTQWNDLGYSIIGPQGPAGATGQTGAAGLRGTQSFSGTSAPTSSNPAGAQAGDFYFQTNSSGTAIQLYQLTGS